MILFKELGDVDKFKSTDMYKFAKAKCKLVNGDSLDVVYTCKTHKGFYYRNSNVGYVRYTKDGKRVEGLIRPFLVSRICGRCTEEEKKIFVENPVFQVSNNMFLSTGVENRLVVLDNDEVCCIVGFDDYVTVSNDRQLGIEQDEKYIIIHLQGSKSILISKSDYSSVWTDKVIRLDNNYKEDSSVSFNDLLNVKVEDGRSKLYGKKLNRVSFCNHKGFYFAELGDGSSNTVLVHSHYSMSGAKIEDLIRYDELLDMLSCDEDELLTKYGSVKIDNIIFYPSPKAKVIILNDDNEVCCIIGTDDVVSKDEVEQDDNCIILPLVGGLSGRNSILIAKSDYSSVWTNRKLSLSQLSTKEDCDNVYKDSEFSLDNKKRKKLSLKELIKRWF